ncbi:MAG: 3-dehydroquinate synthase [Gemmatimonadales bacterium]
MNRATIPISTETGSYDIVVAEGLLKDSPHLIHEACSAAAYAVITDSIVQPLYAAELAAALGELAPSVVFPFPSGEWNKTRDTWGSLTDRMLEARMGRDATVIAVGGGVVGDLAGFTAATYLRGIPYIQVPTTILAMIDSSIGGKTGVDTDHGKNLVGAFHQPRKVLADLATLSTLPEPHMAAGLAEALKHGAIADTAYFERLLADRDAIFERNGEALFNAVCRSIEIKAAVVSEDVHERGRRAILNFGHTAGHAVEALTGYELLHGEAVALGMLIEAELGRRVGISDPGLTTQLLEGLQELDLPTSLPEGVDPGALLDAMEKDKKVRERTVRFALLETLGNPARDSHGNWTIPVPEEVILETLEDFL